MVSKFAQSGIALFLAKRAFAMDGAKSVPPQGAQRLVAYEHDIVNDQKVAEEPPKRHHDETMSYKIIGKTSIDRSMANVYRSEGTPTGAQEIRKFVSNTIAAYTSQDFRDFETQTLAVGWGGMGWPVDGRGDDGKRRSSKAEYIFEMVTPRKIDDRDAHVEDMKTQYIAADMANSTALRQIFEDFIEDFEENSEKPLELPRSCYHGLTLEECKQFYTDLGNMRLSVINKLSGQKPEWASYCDGMVNADFRFDVGTGKAAGSIRDKKGAGKWRKNRVDFADFTRLSGGDLADELYEMEDGKIEERLLKVATKMRGVFESALGNGFIGHDGAVKIAFGLTGKWRTKDDPKKTVILKTFKNCIFEAFGDMGCEINVFEVTGAQEAQYGAISLCEMKCTDPSLGILADFVRSQGVRFLISIESGKGSTQICVVDLQPSKSEDRELDVTEQYSGAANPDAMQES